MEYHESKKEENDIKEWVKEQIAVLQSKPQINVTKDEDNDEEGMK